MNFQLFLSADSVGWEATDILFAISVTCSAIFLLCLPFRLLELRISGCRISLSWQGLFQSALAGILSITLFVYLTQFLNSSLQLGPNFFASLLISVVASLGLSLHLFLDQQRSPRSSDLATLYLVTSILCDVVILTIPSHVWKTNVLCPVLVRCTGHSILLILQSFCKHPAFTIPENSKSPEELSGILEKVFFTWINPILLQGYRNLLVDQDLPPPSQDLKPEATRKVILQTWKSRAKPESKTTLLFALLRCVMKPFLAAIIPRLFLIVFRYSQPVLIKQCIRFVTMYFDKVEGNYGYWLVVSAIAIYVGLAISTSVYQHRLNRLKLMTRSALIGLIHETTMNSPSITYENGESTILMSTDADSIEGIGEMFHETWAQVIEVVIGLCLLAGEVGCIWPLPVFLIFLCSYMSRYVAKHMQPRQKAWNVATQNRVAATASMVGSMKIIKMLGFQRHITDRIQKLRTEELSAASKLRWTMVYYNASANALGIFSPAITLVIFAIISGTRGQKLDTETAFTTIAILSMVTHPANMVMTIVPRLVGSFAGFERIQTFLLRPLLYDYRETLQKATANNISQDLIPELTKLSPIIVMGQVRVGDKNTVLENLNIEINPGSTTIISGPVGSGKTTLLRTILGEIPPSHGSVKVSTRKIGYCAQKPWLPSGSIKEVIHGMTEHADSKWYYEVIDVCCLTHDLDSFSEGDETQIGSRGLNLSGGQRQRVALARALFARCDIILLDDCFSGLDGETEKSVFGNLFRPEGLFRKLGTTIVLVSNSTQYFQVVDQIIVLGNHGIKEQGTWQEIKVKASLIAKFASEPQSNNVLLSTNFDQLGAQVRAKEQAEVDLSRQTGDFTLYGYYYQFIGLTNFLLLISCGASFGFFITIPQYWLQMWTEGSQRTSVFYIIGLLLLSTMSWTSTNGVVLSNLIRLAPRSGMRVHQLLLHIVISAPLSYFSKTDNGSILNRFSQDIQLIDKQLPPALSNVTTQIFKLLMQAALLFVAQKWLALSLPACMLVLYLIQKIYLRTSRQLRFLELEARASVFSSFLESVEGLETIRAFGWSQKVIEENIESVDTSQRPEFLLSSLQRWLNIVLDLLAAAIATGVVAIAVGLRGRVSGGQVGVALNIMLVANTTLLKLVENWTTLEISLGAVARLKSFELGTLSEGKKGSYEAVSDWPSRGEIVLEDVTAAYNPGSIALRNVNLNIKAGQKVIVCGRTGSGKSTLLLTLLRLLELQSGKIELDGVDISRLPLEILRERCFVTVSQDTLLLSNESLRFNMDPDLSLSDETIIAALERTGLWRHFLGDGLPDNSDGEHPVLDTKLSLLRELSVGQCQLFGLCRALLEIKTMEYARVKPVILLDEVTSFLDSVTESRIHQIVHEEFTEKRYTVIIITHRLSVLAGNTKDRRELVVEMGGGRLRNIDGGVDG